MTSQDDSALYTTYPPLEGPPTRRVTINAEAARTLERALAALPSPWRVLRSRRAFPSDGPPWVKYIALHPGHGIALVDFGAAVPEAALMPLAEFLAATGLTVSMRGDPPIAPVGAPVEGIEGAEILPLIEAGFSHRPPCQVADSDWAEFVIEELTETPGLFLTEITRAGTIAPTVPELPPEAVPRMADPVVDSLTPPPEWVPDPSLRMGLSALVNSSHRRLYAKLAAGTLVGAAAAGILLAHTMPILKSGLPTPIAALPATADVALVTDPDVASTPASLAQVDPEQAPRAVPVDLSGGDTLAAAPDNGDLVDQADAVDDWPPPPPEVKPAVVRHREAALHRRRVEQDRSSGFWPHWLVKVFNPPTQSSRRRS